MRVPRIYCEKSFAVGETLQLDDFASGHICRVLRMKAGRPLVLFNGRGGEYSAVLAKADPKRAEVELLEFHDVSRESPVSIHLGLALSRGDRFDWAVQKSVELGVAKITPLHSERSDRIADSKRVQRKLEHWQRLAQSACEQSGRTAIPKILAPQNCHDWCAGTGDVPGYFFAPDKPGIAKQMARIKDDSAEIKMAIGPEGGFSEGEERVFAEQFGFQALSLGPRILRTETAPVVALTLFQYFLGDLN